MKIKLLILVLSACLPISLIAQLTPEQRIQDSVIGWWDNLQYDKKLTAENDPVRKKKIETLDRIVEWMKKSYTPVGGLGTYTRYINSGNFGVQFAVWNVSFEKEWLDKRGKFRPIPEELTKFGISINSVPGSFAIPLMSSPELHVFTWQPDGYGANDQELRKNSQPAAIKQDAAKYITHINQVAAVYLAPGNKLPFTEVSRGEFLDMAEKGLDKQLEFEKKDVAAKWPGNVKAQEDALAYRVTTIEKYRANIRQLKIRYKNSLSEHAVIRHMQPTMYSFELDPDPFTITPIEKEAKSFYPVYKITAGVLEKCKSSQPQWIACWVPVKNEEDGNQLVEMYRAMTAHLNFDYIYNYFFESEKNKEAVYHPSNENQLTTRLEQYRKKIHHAKPVSQQQLPAGVYFNDDFSSCKNGGKPLGWYFSTYGKHAVITTLKNNPGNWLTAGYGNDIFPAWLKKPLPVNFTLEFDMITDPFTTRTGGALRIHLSSFPLLPDGREQMGKPGTSVDLTIIAGNEADFSNNNYMGESRLEIHNNPAIYKDNYSEGLFHTANPRFLTNKNNRVHIKLIVKNGAVSVYQDDKIITRQSDLKMTYGKACTDCILPADTRFNTLSFRNTTNDAALTNVYFGNVKIIAE